MGIWKNKSCRCWLIVTAVVLVLALAVNMVCLTVPIAANSLSLLFGSETSRITEDHRDEWYDRRYSSKEEVLAAARDFVVEVEREGITLLKNENEALPLSQTPKVTVFGKNSVDLVYSGSGSAGNTASANKTLYESLEAAGISYNPKLKAFYEDSAKSGSGRPANPNMDSGQRLSGFATGETPVSSYSDTLRESYGDYSDAAIVVFSRIGGEGFDLPRSMETAFGSGEAVAGAASAQDHYLQLDANEKALLEEAKAHFSKVIVVINAGTTLELAELQQDPGVSAILWIGLPGSTGIMALGEVLTGAVNPSGHTVDTWAADFTKDPTWFNTGVYGSQYGNRYLNADGSSSEFAFVNYEEGIYVGYRYYETRGYEDGEEWYRSNVVYPFGYGLSYTTFDWAVSFDGADRITAQDTVTATVTVTNTGTAAGKDVAELYYSAPYTPGGIEKSQVVLGGFAKTRLLQPGESDTLTLTLNAGEMASYDYADANGNGFRGYELEAGSYIVSVRSDAHTTVAEHTYTVGADEQLSGETVENRFDDVSAGIYGTLTYGDYTSRTDFEGTMRKTYLSDAERTLTPELEEALGNSIKRTYHGSDDGQPWTVTEMPLTQPVNNGISLQDMLYTDGEFTGKADFDDPRWEQLLDEISLEEMKLLVGYGAFRTNAVSGVDGVVDKPLTTDSDGPSGFTSFLSESVVYGTCAYMSECVMGATWNTELAYEMGQLIGEEGLVGNEKGDAMPYSGWYAPAVNIHRNQFAGRNWEYYSEDGLLSGKFAAQVIQGAKSKGVYCYVKHFAVNDQETDREYNGILVWANEQAMRELYLKPFELAVKEGQAGGMMSSFNRLGMTWAGGSYALLTEVLREEWGFQGMVITDYSMNRYTYVDQMIRAGGDLFLTQDAKTFSMADDATQVTLLRKATKNILYTVVNSNVMALEVDGYNMPVWKAVMFVVDGILAVGLSAWGILVISRSRKKRPDDPN